MEKIKYFLAKLEENAESITNIDDVLYNVHRKLAERQEALKDADGAISSYTQIVKLLAKNLK